MLQLRAKTQQAGAFLALIDTVVRSAARRGAAVVVNDRVDLARAAGAAGVHVGQNDLPPAVARAQLGASAVVGVSTHSREQILAAVTQPVSYVAVGPVFETRTKETGYPAGGLQLVDDARRTIAPAIPLVAIGGITLARARDVLVAGASGVAVIGDLLTENPATRVRQYLALLAEARTV
jgi:thiamine-phosphate pyrophosphorylase